MGKGSKVRYLKRHEVLKASDAGDECFLWPHAQDRHGYGLAKVNGRMKRVHRLSYTENVGPIPEGMQIDHMCGNRLCINPFHLRPVTNKQNGEHRTGMQARNTSGWRGVSFEERTGKWVAKVRHNGKLIHVGSFRCPTAAGLAALSKRRELGFLE